MTIDISKLPSSIKLEISKEDLLAFADKIQESKKINHQIIISEAEFIDINEAAIYLKLAKQTIYQLTSKKAIPFFKKGKKIFFKKTELQAWLQEGRQEIKPKNQFQ